MYIFGGEFATSKQFYHHRDTWKLNLTTNRWVPDGEWERPLPQDWRHPSTVLLLSGLRGQVDPH
jgi:hypothetical protein